ncbi:MAG: FliM/FliN family flagellar motor C-terminal domain-containing protein [Pseudomonadota bacterium]
MRMEQTFEPARPLAQHCAELTATGPRPEDRSEFLTIWRRDVGRALSEAMGSLLAGERMSVSLGEPEWITGAQVFDRVGKVAANSLIRCGEASKTMLLSFDFATAEALTDRSFGGDGAMPEQPAEQLPRSAALLIDQAAMIIAQAITDVSCEEGAVEARGDVIVRSESAARLKPFGPATPCALFVIELTAENGASWKSLLAMPADRLDGMLPGLGAAKSSGSAAQASHSGAFDTIPLPLEAVLAEFNLSLGKLDQLAPGDEIALTVPREIPLRTGSTMLAHGSVGTLEDRMAVRLTRISQGTSGQ